VADHSRPSESQAICRYLVAKYGKASGLAPSPSDGAAYGKFEQALAVEIFCYHTNAAELGFAKKFAP
jgi:glutathione S-transferase